MKRRTEKLLMSFIVLPMVIKRFWNCFHDWANLKILRSLKALRADMAPELCECCIAVGGTCIRLLECMVQNDIDQRYENNERVKNVEVVSDVEVETKTCHLKQHF